jgi:hypothetical protein
MFMVRTSIFDADELPIISFKVELAALVVTVGTKGERVEQAMGTSL